MNVNFVPSLQHMLHVKFASTIFNELEVKPLETDNDWEKILNKASEKISGFSLPVILKEKMEEFIKPLGLEIEKWYRDHYSIFLKWNGEIKWPSKIHFYWKLDGTIDRKKTARSFAENKKIDNVHRFIIACYYCLDDCMMDIWRNMVIRKKKFLYSKFQSSGKVGYSTQWHSMFIAHMRCRIIHFYEVPEAGMYILFQYISFEDRVNYLVSLPSSKYIGNPDLHFCLSTLLNEDELMRVIQGNPIGVLCSFLNWPFHNEFLTMAKKMWTSEKDVYLSDVDFVFMLQMLLEKRDVLKLPDSDYLILVREFWNQSPLKYKEFAKKNKIYQTLCTLLKI